MNAEEQRLNDTHTAQIPWKKWGPYLTERQWGTVREDYSADGDAWNYFSHDMARSRAYHRGEDGLAGISDDRLHLCFALALWNGQDAILKERLFGLTNSEGNHGEDVKEYYFYLDSTPTHSYMHYLYKYPQVAYPYSDLVQTNQQRSRTDLEYELLDTGVFDHDRYFDVFVEYAKADPEDILIRITLHNRGAEEATLHVLPHFWFRNTWSWSDGAPKPIVQRVSGPDGIGVIAARHETLGERFLYCAGDVPLLFTENETNTERLSGQPNASPYVKDGINNAVVAGQMDAINPEQSGTKAAAHYQITIAPGASTVIRLRLTEAAPDMLNQAYADTQGDLFQGFDELCATRQREADAFYATITPAGIDDDSRNVMRQALAGMLWSKQYYTYDVFEWLKEHGVFHAASAPKAQVRNQQWTHMVNEDIISMPDKWEYPWYAAWDLAFHTIPLSMVDVTFAKQQLALMLQENYLHPSSQIPAYEWNFGDVNPPVHAWASLRIYRIEQQRCGQGDITFLADVFNKLALNFAWWVNRKDKDGSNVFEGGFLGLDNIGVFDRSSPLPTGGYLEQSDGTAWMAFFSLSMLQIALELAAVNPSYERMAYKFYLHFLLIHDAMNRIGDNDYGLWDEEDGFFYDILRLPDGQNIRLKVRSLVGLLPLAACAIVEPEAVQRLTTFMEQVRWLEDHRPELTQNIPSIRQPGVNNRRMLALLDEHKLRCLLSRMLDENEFLSPYGIRSLSRYHHEHPYEFWVNGTDYRVNYLPGDSNSGMFGGNSNWRGPIWFPMNLLLIRGLIMLHAYYGDTFTVECPTGSGQQMTLWQVSQNLASRLARIFLRDETGHRPVYGGTTKFQTDPHWRDLILFYEYFHGDNGAGIGASHQTGWTGVVAYLIWVYFSVTDFEAGVATGVFQYGQKVDMSKA